MKNRFLDNLGEAVVICYKVNGLIWHLERLCEKRSNLFTVNYFNYKKEIALADEKSTLVITNVKKIKSTWGTEREFISLRISSSNIEAFLLL